MVDNQLAIALVKNPILHDRSKHIDVKFHFLRDCIDGCQIVIEFIETGRQLTDILTKPLGRLQFSELKKMIGMEGVLGLAVGLWEKLLSNLLLPCMNARQGQTSKGSILLHCSCCRGRDRRRKAPCCCTVAVAGEDAERLPCRTVAIAGADAKVSPAVISSHCSSMAVGHVCVLGLDG